MKTKLTFLILLCGYLAFGQANLNQSLVGVQPAITQPIGPFSTEIFRFRSGLVTQLDNGTSFGFGVNNNWFSLGRLSTTSQTLYGLRFQNNQRGLVMGYADPAGSTNPNPFIQWIGNGTATGNLQFRAATSFGTIGTPATDLLVATMKSNGNTIFGNPANISSFRSNAKVAIEFNGTNGLYILGNQPNTGLGIGEGIYVSQERPIQSNYAITAFASNGSDNNIAIYGSTSGGSGNDFAGFFVGNVTATGSITQASDEKLKENMNAESTALEKISKLKPVTYKYKEIKQLNLPKEMQHGFVAQDIETIFPELVKDISQPVFDKEGKTTENYRYKAVNYNGLISVLTAGIKELFEKVNELEKALTAKDTKSSMKISQDATSKNQDFFMDQNIPNPFAGQTTIRYQLPNGTNTADIMVFDLNGLLVKSFPINRNQNEITIKASDIGRGIFIYSLVQNGQELLTKKMIVK